MQIFSAVLYWRCFADCRCIRRRYFAFFAIKHYAGNELRFANHSCNPNCRLEVMCWEDSPALSFVATRPIQPQEEITFHYNLAYQSGEAVITCECKSTNCQGFLNIPEKNASKELQAEFNTAIGLGTQLGALFALICFQICWMIHKNLWNKCKRCRLMMTLQMLQLGCN